MSSIPSALFLKNNKTERVPLSDWDSGQGLMCLPLMVLISAKILGQSSSLDQSGPSLLPSRCYTLNKDAQCRLTPYSTAVLLPACTEHLECMWLYSPRLLPTLSVHWDLKKHKMGRETSSVNTFVVQVKSPKFQP